MPNNTVSPYTALVMNYPQQPGEDATAYASRLQRAATGLAQQRQLAGQTPGGGYAGGATPAPGIGAPGGGGTGNPVADFINQTLGMGGGGAGGEDEIQKEWERAMQLYQQQRGIYDQGLGQTLEGALMGQLTGGDQPFNQQVQQNLMAEVADASAGGVASEADLIRSAFANAGLGGSGIEASAQMSSQRRARREAQKSRRDVQTRAQLENYQARERAQARAAPFLQQKAQAKWAPTQAEAGARLSRRLIQDIGGQNIATAAAGAPAGMGGGGVTQTNTTPGGMGWSGTQNMGTGGLPHTGYARGGGQQRGLDAGQMAAQAVSPPVASGFGAGAMASGLGAFQGVSGYGGGPQVQGASGIQDPSAAARIHQMVQNKLGIKNPGAGLADSRNFLGQSGPDINLWDARNFLGQSGFGGRR
jgi:hypothetical protein